MEPVRTAETDQWLDELTRPEGRDDPYPRYAALRRAAPVALAEDGAIVLTRYADCQAVLQDPRFGRPDAEEFLDAVGLSNWRDLPAIWTLNTSMLSINPPDHTRLRRLVSKAFTARKVEQLRTSVAELVDRLAAELEGGGDFVELFAFPLPVAVIGELLGVPEADRAAFQPLVRDWTMILDVFTPDVLDRANAAAAEMRAYLGDLAEERRRSPQDDLISDLVMIADGGDRLTSDELVTMAALLFSAGFETTTHLLGNGLVALLDHPDQAEALRSDPDLVPSAIEELVRFDSSVQITGRTALADTEVAGVPTPAGSRLVCYLGAANRDPARFTDPDRLDLARHEGAPLSFGGGAHYCLGAPLARLEAQLAFPTLLRRYPEIALAEGAVRRDSLTLRGYLSLPVEV
jgi:cytochrome P450